MKLREISPFRVHYLSVNGIYLTPNTPAGYSPSIVTGPLTASTVTDPIVTQTERELAINLTVQSISGVAPTLDLYLDVLEPIEPQNFNLSPSQNDPIASVKLNPVQITSTRTNLRALIVNGQLVVWQGNASTSLGPFNVPMRWQLRLVIGGSGSSYGIIGTFEARA